jgi:hypothetical protein
MLRIPTLAVGWLAVVAMPLPAQKDYRNLDDERPVLTEDAYPIEHRAIEVMVPFTLERHDGADGLEFNPELMWGALANLMVGAKAPIVFADGERSELAGVRVFALANLNTELPWLPALSIRTDLALPGGRAGGDGTLVAVKGIATRSWGVWRAHLNGVRTFGDATDAPRTDAPPRWSGSLAVDRTFWRQSLLLVGEVVVAEPIGTDLTTWRAGVGVRWQFTPSIVLDAGAFRRLSAEGPDAGVTFGLSHTIGWRALFGGVS